MHSPWQDPEVTALGRLPATASLHRSDSDLIQLDSTWKFQLCMHPAEVPADWHSLDTQTWLDVELPHLWTMDSRLNEDNPIYTNVVMPFRHEPPALPSKNPTGIYRRTITVPENWLDDRLVIHVGGVESFFFLYCNGHEVGYAKDSKLPSEFDLTRYLTSGTNELALQVIKYCDASYIEDQDHWWHGGIHRSVYLYRTPQVFIQDVFITPDFDPASSRGNLDTRIRIGGKDRAALNHTIEAQLRSPQDKPLGRPVSESISRSEFNYVIGKGPVVDLALPWRKVSPWSAETPALYELEVSLRDDVGDVLETFRFWVGFRRIEIRDRELLVNGTAILIRGVNRHDHHPDSGRVMTREDIQKDILQMKRHNINAIRTSHYPNDSCFYDLCDELGMYVVDEANIEAHHHYARLGNEPVWANQFLSRGQRMVERDKNHPSIILWSMGNETGFGPNHMAMTGWIKQYDPSRPIHNENAICEQGVQRLWNENQQGSDVICPMYPSVDDIIQHAKTSDDPRPLIMCEFAHAMGNSCGNLKEYWDAVETWHGLQGGFVWEWKDHGIRAESNGIEYWAYGGDFGEDRHDLNFVCDGLCWPDGAPHSSLIEYKKVIQPISVTRRSKHYRLTNKHDHIDLSGYDVSWYLLADGEVQRQGKLKPFKTPPGFYEDFNIDVGELAADRESVLRIEFRLREASNWAKSGHLVAWDQFLIGKSKKSERQARVGETPVRHSSGRLSNDDLAITFDNDNIRTVEVAGRVISTDSPQLNFWRAPMDNDGIKGWSGQEQKPLGSWQRDGLDQIDWQHDMVFEESSRRSFLKQESRGLCPGGVIEVISIYELIHNRLAARHHCNIPETISDLPRIGVRWRLEPEFEQLCWYGLGPHETYPDRKCSGVLQVHHSNITAQYVPYILPQEHGNLSEVRWLMVNDGQTALKVTGNGDLQTSVSHYPQEALTEAFHTYELNPSAHTWLCLDAAQRGVGGASCGPDTLEKYRIGPGRYELNYTMEFGAWPTGSR